MTFKASSLIFTVLNVVSLTSISPELIHVYAAPAGKPLAVVHTLKAGEQDCMRICRPSAHSTSLHGHRGETHIPDASIVHLVHNYSKKQAQRMGADLILNVY